MNHLPSSIPLSEALIPGDRALIGHNPDEEMGFAGKKNHELIPDIRLYTCRSVLTVTDDGSGRHTVVVPEDCARVVRRTAALLRDGVGIPGRLHPDAVLGIPFRSTDSLFSALQHLERGRLHQALGEIDCLSYTMFSPQLDAFRREHSDLAAFGSLGISEAFNNKALAADICAKADIPTPATAVAFTPADARTAYEGMKREYGLPLLLKGARSASGFAMRLVEDDVAFERALSELGDYLRADVYPVKNMTPADAVGLVVQEYVRDVEASPGAAVIVGATPGSHTFVGVTEQLLDAGHHHQGNIHPVSAVCTPAVQAQMLASLEKAADAAAAMGGEGMMLCADFVVSDSDVFLVEFNMRLSAQYGGLALAHDLFGTSMPEDRSYFVGNTPLRSRGADAAFSSLRERGLLYDGRSKTGCVPLNLTIPGQMQSVVFAESPSRVHEMVGAVRGL